MNPNNSTEGSADGALIPNRKSSHKIEEISPSHLKRIGGTFKYSKSKNLNELKQNKTKLKRQEIENQVLEAERKLQERTEAFLRRCPLVREFHLECKDK